MRSGTPTSLTALTSPLRTLSSNSLVSVGAVSPTNVTALKEHDKELSTHDNSMDNSSSSEISRLCTPPSLRQVHPHPKSPPERAFDAENVAFSDEEDKSRVIGRDTYDVDDQSIRFHTLGDTESHILRKSSWEHQAESVSVSGDNAPESLMDYEDHSNSASQLSVPSDSLTSTWIKERFEMVSPTSYTFPPFSSNHTDTPSIHSLRSEPHVEASSSPITSSLGLFSLESSITPISRRALEEAHVSRDAFSSITTPEPSEVDPEVTISVSFNAADLDSPRSSFQSRASSSHPLSIRTDTRVEHIDEAISPKSPSAKRPTLTRRLSKLFARKVSAVMHPGRNSPQSQSQLSSTESMSPVIRRRFTLLVAVDIETPERVSAAPSFEPNDAPFRTVTAREESTPLQPWGRESTEEQEYTVHITRERGSFERLMERVQGRHPVDGISMEQMDQREREYVRAHMRRYST